MTKKIVFELSEGEYAHYCTICAEYQPLLDERTNLIIERYELRAQTARDAVTISNLAERLAKLGAANPHEEMEI